MARPWLPDLLSAATSQGVASDCDTVTTAQASGVSA
jgi:hypothetical protein